MEIFLTVWIASGQSGNFPDRLSLHCLHYCCNIHILHFCKECFCTLACMLRMRFTHFWRIYVAKAIYVLLAHICRENDLRTLSGKCLRVKFCQLEIFDFLCLCCLTVRNQVWLYWTRTFRDAPSCDNHCIRLFVAWAAWVVWFVWAALHCFDIVVAITSDCCDTVK